MKHPFLLSLFGGLAPVILLAIAALTQHGHYSYNSLGGIFIFIEAGYVILLLPVSIILLLFKKKKVGFGLLACFGIGFFITLVSFGMGL
jgi:hypothetical protein